MESRIREIESFLWSECGYTADTLANKTRIVVDEDTGKVVGFSTDPKTATETVTPKRAQGRAGEGRAGQGGRLPRSEAVDIAVDAAKVSDVTGYSPADWVLGAIQTAYQRGYAAGRVEAPPSNVEDRQKDWQAKGRAAIRSVEAAHAAAVRLHDYCLRNGYEGIGHSIGLLMEELKR